MLCTDVEKCSPPLLRSFRRCPGPRNPAALYLLDQLRSCLGENSQSCSAPGWKNVHHPFSGASTIAPVPATLRRCSWLINSADLLVKFTIMFCTRLEKCSPRLLRCFLRSPGPRTPALLFLADQLRRFGEKSRSCYAPTWKSVHHPFCGPSAVAPVPATLPRCTWLINSAALLVKIHNHVLHQVGKMFTIPLAELQRLPRCPQPCGVVAG